MLKKYLDLERVYQCDKCGGRVFKDEINKIKNTVDFWICDLCKEKKCQECDLQYAYRRDSLCDKCYGTMEH